MAFLFESIKEDDETKKEIRKLQLERGKAEGRLISFSEVSYDTEFYSKPSAHDENFVDSIPVSGDQDIESEEEEATLKQIAQGKKTFLNSFTAPEKYFEELKETKDVEDPFKDHKRKTVADKEDEYKARWRKRKLSPERIDPFQRNGEKDEKGNERNSYRDVMQDAELEKEKAEVVEKIKQKQREQELEQQQKMMDSKKKKKGKDHHDSSPSKKAKKEKSSSERHEEEWRIQVKKQGQVTETLVLTPDITYTLGRDQNCEIMLAHESCSKRHAKILFMRNHPYIVDLNSTNGTFVNQREIPSGEEYKLKSGDIIKFGCSTREYHVQHVE